MKRSGRYWSPERVIYTVAFLIFAFIVVFAGPWWALLPAMGVGALARDV